MDKKLLRFLLLSLVFLSPLLSQHLFLQNGNESHPQVLGYNSQQRTVFDLAGEWDYSLDNGISWKKIKVPSAANYEGKILFRKKFLMGLETISNSTFKFVSYGINYQADIYINETLVGRHEGGYTSFELTIPDNVIQVGAENVIKIAVDNTLDYKSTFPLRIQVNGWKNYGGITRDLFIVALPRIWIDDVKVAVDAIEPKGTRLLVTSTIVGKESEIIHQLENRTFHISAEVNEVSSGIVVGKPFVSSVTPELNKETQVQVSVIIPNAKLWTPETPDLYSVKVSLMSSDGKKDTLLDETSITTGVRTFIKDKNTLLLNGAPVTMHGIVWIEDSEEHGSAITYEEMERDVALIKNLGANTIRIGFHPPHPFFVQLCNRYGLFVMEEIPNYEIPSTFFDDENYRLKVENYLKEVIHRDQQNPSIIAWGIGDGSGVSENNISHLNRAAKSLDDRLTYFVTRGENKDGLTIPDIAAISLAGDNVKSLQLRLNEFKDKYPRQPIIVSGYGKIAEKGNRNGYSDPNSQESQARFILQCYSIMKDMKIAGSLVFSFNDFRSDRPILSVKPIVTGVHTYGIVELDRKKKSAYDVLYSLYHEQKISALPLGSFVTPLPYVYVFIGLGLLVVAAWLVNGNRRFRESTRRAIINSYNFFADIRDQFTLPLFHTTITAIIISATFSLIFASILHHFRTSVALDYFLSYLLPDTIKQILIKMAWDPLFSIGYLSCVMMIWFIVLTFGIQFFSKIARVKIRIFHSYSIAVWTALPWVFFIPVGMILYRVLQSEPYVPWILGIVVFTCFWIYLRTLKGISVMYNIYTPKMYGIGIILMIVVISGLIVYLDYANSFLTYIEFFFSSILPFVN